MQFAAASMDPEVDEILVDYYLGWEGGLRWVVEIGKWREVCGHGFELAVQGDYMVVVYRFDIEEAWERIDNGAAYL